MSELQSESDESFDVLMRESADPVVVSHDAVRLSREMAREAWAAGRRRKRWSVAGAIAGGLAVVGATAAFAAPLLNPLPGFTEVAEFHYGAPDWKPGISCMSIIAIRPTPQDPQYDPKLVTEFTHFFAAQNITVPVPAQAEEPFTGEQSQLMTSPGAMALNRSYSITLERIYQEFDTTFGSSSHSFTVEDTATCKGNK